MQLNEWMCLIMLLLASYTDIQQQKIKNFWVILFFLIGVLFYRSDFLFHVLIVLIVLFPLYFIRVIGAGDLKLVALIIGYLKIQNSLKVIYIGLIFAGIHSLYIMISKKLIKERICYLTDYVKNTITTGMIRKYHSFNTSKHETSIPMAPFFLLGFLIWRTFILWKIRV